MPRAAVRYIAFLRAINVGGRTVRKEQLAGIFQRLGFRNVETFIASGNVIFDTKPGSRRALEARIETALRDALGYDVAAFVRTTGELAAIAGYEPFRPAEVAAARAFNVAFLADELGPEGMETVHRFRSDIDDFHVHGRELYWLCRGNQNESKFTNVAFERVMKMRATFRGISTIRKMADKYLRRPRAAIVMGNPIWAAVDRYLAELYFPPDPALDAVLAESAAAELPPIHVPPAMGRFLKLIAEIQGANRILEIGTLAGYSTIWLARALGPGGRVITLEIDPKYAELARANFARAGVADRIDLRLGRAEETLADLVRRGEGPFDLIFIDADKPSYAQYFTAALELARPGTVIIADNVIRDGGVADSATADAKVQGVRRFDEIVAATPRVSSTTLQTVGQKGYDGFAIMRVLR